MAFTYEQMMNFPIPVVEQTLTPDDCMVYALSIGVGADPLDERQLKFVYEDDLMAIPTIGNVLAYPGFWVKDPATGVDWAKVLHGEQSITIHQPIPTNATLVGTSRVTGINDKGPEKGAFMYSERVVVDKATGERVCALEQTSVLRGNGGCGGNDSAPRVLPRPPERAPDAVCELDVLPQAALIYRLNGDRNPLHADPKVAASAGFKQPILHGLCTLAVAGHAILKTLCDYDPTRLEQMALRFTSPVYPGERLRTEMWREDGSVAFRTTAVERDIVVLGNGQATVR